MPDWSGSPLGRSVSVVSPGAYAVSDEAGDIGLSGGGLFYRDMRHLSGFALRVNGEAPAPEGFRDGGSEAEFRLRFPAGAPGVRVARRRRVGDGMEEVLEVSSLSGRGTEVVVSLECAADFRDIYEVRDYAHPSARGDLSEEADGGSLRFAYRRGGFSRGTVVRVSGVGVDPVAEPGRISCVLRLGPGESRTIRVSVGLEEGGREVGGTEHAPLYAGAPELETDWEALRRSWERSVEDLESLTFDAGDGLLVPAAGSPWFMALFGRDSLITAYQAMILTPEPARNVLRALARHQATEYDDHTDAEPGKIPHELRRGELAFFEESPETPYYGTVDATPLFLVLLHELWRWTADAGFAREMEGAARRALAWCLEHSDQVNGYVAYEARSPAGLKNLSWKDSDDSMLFRDGRRARGKIAPVEVQGYVYDALLGAAELAEKAWGDAHLGVDLRARAADLRARFDRDFWMEDRGYYALALDGEGRRVDSVTSNPGHLLWSGLVPADKARAVADRLVGPELFSGWGVRTMAAGEGGYDPGSYHNGSVWPHDNALIALGLRRCGFRKEANRVATALLEAAPHFDYRLPEVFGGDRREEEQAPVEYPTSCSPQAWAAGTVPLLVRTVLGLEPDPRGRNHPAGTGPARLLVPEALFRR
jgi:glycogen debranching enzyme